MAVQKTYAAKMVLVSKQIELTKLLASNDPKTRNNGLVQIKQLLMNNSADTNDAFLLNDYIIIWRGLFYFMWMSDKPIPQEIATEKISNLLHCCISNQGKVLFLEAFFHTIKDDWMSISQHRIDKFMMLVRRFLRQVLFTFVNCCWDLEYMQKFNEVLYKALKSFTLSLRTHLQEIFLEELAKVSKGKVPSEALIIILDAFLHYISELNDFLPIKEVVENVFRNLLSQSPELEILEAKYLAWKKMGKPGKSYNDLELVEGDIADEDSNEQSNMPLDPRAGNVNVEIPRIKFNAKDVTNLLNKYVNEVNCTRKCLIEITKLLRWYNRLGEGILPYKPKDLKLNSQVLKRKKRKNLSKMVKEGVKKLKMVDSRIKKINREVINNHKSLKELDKMGEIIVEHGQIGKSIWKVRKFEKCNALDDHLKINESWTVSDDTENIDEKNKTVCETADDEISPSLVSSGFSVEVVENSENTPSKMSLKSLLDNSPKNSNSKKSKSPKLNISNQSFNTVNRSHNNSWSVSADKNGSASKKLKKSQKSPKAENCILPNDGIEKIIQPTVKSPKTNDTSATTNVQLSPCDNFVLSKVKRQSNEIIMNQNSPNTSWSVCIDDKLNLNKSTSPKSIVTDNSITLNSDNKKVNSPSLKICSPNISINNSWPASAEKNIKKRKRSIKVEKRNSLSTVVTPDKNSKSPKSPKSPTPEQRVLRRRTIIITRKKPGIQDEGTPKRKVKDKSEIKVLQKRRQTIAGEKISMLKPEEISNKVLEKVRSEVFDNDLDSTRKSSRLSIKTNSAKKKVEFQLKNNVEQEVIEYKTTLVTNPENPHDAYKQPIQGVLKLTPEVNRINPFYKFSDRSAKRNSRKSVI